MQQEVKARAGLVPFGYPGYPDSYLDRFTQESVEMLERLGIDLVATPIVNTFPDGTRAREILRKGRAQSGIIHICDSKGVKLMR